jgi:acyl carrier protein
MSDTLNKVQGIFRDVFDNEMLTISRQTGADDIEEWDSLAHVSLVVAMEKEFNIKFSLDELQQMMNVGNILDLIERKTA